MPVCPRCSASNADSRHHCERCGISLESRRPPGNVEQLSEDLAPVNSETAAQYEKLNAMCRRARAIMLALGVLECAVGCIVTAVGFAAKFKGSADARVFGPLLVSIGVVFLGLAFWARKSPLAASVVGLTIFLGIIITAAVVNPSSLSQVNPLKTVVLMVLGSAVYQGWQHHRLQRELITRGAWPNHRPAR